MTENEKDLNEPQEKAAENEWMDLLKTILWAVGLALLIRTFIAEPFNIPSGSMKPGLLVGDYLFVSKYAYGYSRYSAPYGLLPVPGDRVMGAEPERGDPIVFKLPTDNATDYIKRVIGLPGDRIQVRDGRVFINGEMLEREFVDRHEIEDRFGRVSLMNEYIETLPDGRRYHIFEEGDNGPLDNTKLFEVPEGHYFMMGDNRDNSQDSRVQDLVGFVPYQNLVGRAAFLFFSTDGNAKLWEVWNWPWAIRYDRLLKGIE